MASLYLWNNKIKVNLVSLLTSVVLTAEAGRLHCCLLCCTASQDPLGRGGVGNLINSEFLLLPPNTLICLAPHLTTTIG